MIFHLADYFMPAGFTAEDEPRRRARFLVLTSLLTSLFSTNFLVLSIYLGFVPGVYAMVFNVGVFLLIPFLFKYRWISRRTAGLLYLVCGYWGVIWPSIFAGGFHATVLLWLFIIPLLAVLLRGIRMAIVLSCGSIFTYSVFWWVEQRGLTPPSQLPPEIMPVWDLTNYVSIVSILLLVSWIYYSTEKRLISKLWERNRQLVLERDKSERLLLNILPRETADELIALGKAGAKGFDNVTVVFTDFVNFSTISQGLTPERVVEELDYYFQGFDEIVDKYQLEKIKTIGDAYMCVGGVPMPLENHAHQAVLAALDMIGFVKDAKNHRPDSPQFRMRIGIHTGKVVAGVVGKNKFAYDIWGDAVNLAARMEQNSEPDCINISETTYNLVKSKFTCTARGMIQTKNIGQVDMYFVEEAETN